jgi:hypothetical protein
VNSGPHAHDEPVEPRVDGPGPWGWPCPACATENVIREIPAPPTSGVCELRCDYCGAVTEFDVTA